MIVEYSTLVFRGKIRFSKKKRMIEAYNSYAKAFEKKDHMFFSDAELHIYFSRKGAKKKSQHAKLFSLRLYNPGVFA
jgi:hypothetical protein